MDIRESVGVEVVVFNRNYENYGDHNFYVSEKSTARHKK